MTRNLTTAVKTEAESQGAKFVHLVRMDFSVSPLRLTTGDAGLSLDVGDGAGVVSWSSLGGDIDIDPVNESGDFRKQKATLTLPGVDQTIVAKVLGEDSIGRTITIWRVYFSGSTAIADPVRLFRGRMSGGWEIDDTRPSDGVATTTIKLTALNLFALMDRVRTVRTNIDSYRLAFPEFAEDAFFNVVPDNEKKREPWGQTVLEEKAG